MKKLIQPMQTALLDYNNIVSMLKAVYRLLYLQDNYELRAYTT